MNKMNKFVLSTLVAAAAMTSTAWAEGTTGETPSTETVESALANHNTYTNKITEDTGITVGESGYATTGTEGKLFLYSDANLTFKGAGTIDVSSHGRFYLMDVVVESGAAVKSVDFSNVATATIANKTKLKTAMINVGQAIDTDDVNNESGNVTRDGGAMNLVVDGVLDHKNFYVASGSSLVVSEMGKVTNHSSGGDNHVRAGGRLVVNGNGEFSADAPQFKSNWISNRGGDMEFNKTYAIVGTLKLNADMENAVVTGDNVATLTLDAATLDTYQLQVNNADSSVFVKKGSTLISSGSGFVNEGTISVENSKIESRGTSTNNGMLTVSGTSTIKADTLTSAGEIIYVGKQDGARSKITLGSVSADAVTITYDKENSKSASVYVFNSDVTLSSDLIYDNNSHDYSHAYLYFNGSELDLNGKKVTVTGGKFITRGLTLTGSGVFSIKDTTHSAAWQDDNNVIDKDVVFTSNTATHFYGNTTIYGTVNTALNTGNSDLIGSSASGFEDSLTAKLTVSGGNYTTNNGLKITSATNSLAVVEGGSVCVAKSLTNNGTIEVGEGSTLTASVITGTGDVVLAGTINVTKSLTTGNLTIVEGATLNIGPMVALFAASASEESTLQFDTLTIELKDGTTLEQGEGLDLSSILGEGSTGLDELQSAIATDSTKVLLKDSSGLEYTVTTDANGNVKVGALTPEPSAFGLLAGLGAIALAVSRRRRNRR